MDIDESEFSELAQRHRRELHVHCYRMLGSFEDAEDTVQETFLRAWRRRETFEGRSTFRAWLYGIATNACLDLLAKRRPREATGGEVRWLQPYPDALLDELLVDDAEQPEALVEAQETIELAFLVAVQHLAPRPRAALILRDVLGWPAKDVAELLGDSVHSVNSALQRARAGMRDNLPAERQDWSGGAGDARAREVLRRYVDAGVATDVAGLAALLRDDVRSSMPPTPGLHVGRDAVVRDWIESGFEEMEGLRTVLTSVNRQPAVAFYHWKDAEGAYLPLTLDVLRIAGGAVTEITTFHADQFPRLSLPERLPGDDADASPGPTPRPRRLRRVALIGLAAALVATVLTTLAAVLAHAAGIDFEVPEGGETIPWSGFAVITFGFALVGVLIAVALGRWSSRPARRFLWTTVLLTVVSLVPPLVSGAHPATAAVLVGLHLLPAVIMIATLTRELRARSNPGPLDTPAGGRQSAGHERSR